MVEPWLRHIVSIFLKLYAHAPRAARTAPQVSTAHAKIGTNPTRKVRKDSSHGRAMAQACRIDFSKIVRARAARRAGSAASFYRACTKTSLKLNGLVSAPRHYAYRPLVQDEGTWTGSDHDQYLRQKSIFYVVFVAD